MHTRELRLKGYDYWALGHVHQRDELCADPPIIFPGNIQGRHVREPAVEGKGVTLVEVSDGAVRGWTHVALDTVRWTQLSVDISNASSIEGVYLLVAEATRSETVRCGERLLAVRITLTGNGAVSLDIHRDLSTFDIGLRSYIQGILGQVWIEEIRVRTRSEAAESLATDHSSLGDLLSFVQASADDGRLGEVEQRLKVLRDRIRQTTPDLVDELDLDNLDVLRDLLPDIEETILSLASGAK